VAEETKNIFRQDTKEKAMEMAKAVVKKWYMAEPKAMESLRFNLEYCLTYMDFPKEKWSKIRTTNLLEREFRELRRRMKVFDNTFQNEESANRYANTMINYLNNNYPLKGGLHTNA
jgi:transposase-like protein